MKTKRYLFGWVAGTDNHPDGEWLVEKRGKSRRPMTGGRAVAIPVAVIFPTREKALAEIHKQQPDPRWPGFVRGYAYETPNAENAKGLELFCAAKHGKFYI